MPLKAPSPMNAERPEVVNVYIDGPNLLGAVSDLRKKRLWIDPFLLAQRLIIQARQTLRTIYYAETPYPEDTHSPETFRKQQSFFGHLHKYLKTGQVTHIQGVYRIEHERVPAFIVDKLAADARLIVSALVWKRPREKGGDVGLAVQMVRDAALKACDRLILVAADQDYAPAVNIIQADLGRPVSIAYVQNTYRNAVALRNRCDHPHFIQITRRMIDACELAGEGKG